MAAGTLYSYPESFRAYKVLIAAQYSAFNIETPSFTLGQTNKSADFLRKFPLGKVPALETKDGNTIFESNAIAYYVANEQLRGKNILDQSQIIQWISFADNELLPAVCTWVFPCLGIMQYNKQTTERAKEEIRNALKVLNDHLLSHTYLVGERITLADITVVCNLLLPYQHVLEPSFRNAYINVNRWFTTLINQPQFKAVLGDISLCEKMAQFDAKKFADMQGKNVKEKGKGKEDKQQKTPKDEKKKEKKQQAIKEEPEEPEDEADLILAQEPKSKDPFEKFPKGTFNMDEFKRTYSNEDEKVSIAYFWNKFDKENYSVWFCEYKYPEELTQVFMSCNLISGMFQRLDKMRKHAFSSMILFGEDNNSTISGVWIWRGHELAFQLCEDWQIDYESYSWKKLDFDSEDTKKIVTEYFAWSGDFNGKKFNQGKIFK